MFLRFTLLCFRSVQGRVKSSAALTSHPLFTLIKKQLLRRPLSATCRRVPAPRNYGQWKMVKRQYHITQTCACPRCVAAREAAHMKKSTSSPALYVSPKRLPPADIAFTTAEESRKRRMDSLRMLHKRAGEAAYGTLNSSTRARISRQLGQLTGQWNLSRGGRRSPTFLLQFRSNGF